MAYWLFLVPKWNFWQQYKKFPEKLTLNFSRRAVFHMNTRICRKDFFHFVSANCFLPLSCLGSFRLDFLMILVTVRPLTQFQRKSGSTCKKVLKLALLYIYFPDLFTEVPVWYWKPSKFGLGCYFRKIKHITKKKKRCLCLKMELLIKP